MNFRTKKRRAKIIFVNTESVLTNLSDEELLGKEFFIDDRIFFARQRSYKIDFID